MTHVEWQFGGALRGWPVLASASLFAALAFAGLVYVVWSYRRARGDLSTYTRQRLAALRAAMVLLLLLCLANPVRVEESPPAKNPARTLAVLVDRSASMSLPDHRGETRLAAALRRWHQVEPAARQNFARINYRRFANDVQPAGSLEEAATAGAAGSETHLFDALHQALADNPAAVVCLTDGLDTSADDGGKFAAEAVERGIPIYFVPGENRLQPGASLALREVRAPSRVLRQTQFTATALIEMTAAQDQDLPVELWINGKKTTSARLPVRSGRNALSWPVTVDSGDPGMLTLEFRAGDQSASCVADVVASQTMEVLYYQGALQWGYRFLRGALETDPSFRLTAILNPALQVQLATAPANAAALTDLPDDAAELKRFQIVILAHVFANQLTPLQQQALVDYVRGGGGVLFISPDTAATEGFSGTALEQMLPVVFETGDPVQDSALQQMRLELSAHATLDGSPGAGGSQTNVLFPFALPPGTKHAAASRLFTGTNPLPQFSENARVRAVKPGAETLAVSGAGSPDVLLARQQFGSGFAAALTTDLLWRWKMSLPSTSHAVEQFWQQLLLSLAPGTGEGLHVTRLTESPTINSPAIFSVVAATDNPPKLEAISPDGAAQRLVLTEAANADSPAWQASFSPTSAGHWEVRATDADGRTARVVFGVGQKSASAELLNLPADLTGMRLLAESTGGALLDGTTSFQPSQETAARPAPKLPVPLWNSGALLLFALALYATELILRRRWKLL